VDVVNRKDGVSINLAAFKQCGNEDMASSSFVMVQSQHVSRDGERTSHSRFNVLKIYVVDVVVRSFGDREAILPK
jgi:hypothetical protein